ncbi:outer membrane beta-barrel protein [Pedobacter gandavensis]|uniref:Outer membrane beta-barrel protein n=1 Tax=Pedobacter gandavensis TaxID=2679963 RepID=A0ABR6ESE4_9SPHI|nr:outer membrane beta-barrel protein [Pedobacter gandavensis]MBB2148151.1 outer membrane beta-barrel protein [Pedobacter gandavensis]
MNLNVNFVLRKQDVVQSQGSLSGGGRFEWKGLTPGKFFLLLSALGYANHRSEFDLDLKNPSLDLGKITLLLKAQLLEEVKIFATVQPITIKGDTTEYHARAFQSNPNDKVENLLKQLPGISIDKAGKLSAQGQTITKILVDGMEFFGDDPTLVTKNIRADMVDKLQVFEKQNDLATLTGVKDGKGARTLNITLKADRKKGYFGKVELGMGTDGYYGSQLMLNLFNGQQRIAVYGVAGNNGTTSLSWQDEVKYASSSVDLSVPGYQLDLGGYDELESRSGRYEGQGLPVARTSGLHYEDKWNKDKNSLNFNYKIGSLKTIGERGMSSQNSLPSEIVNTHTDQVFENEVFRQKLDGLLDFKLDSIASLKIVINAGLKNIHASTEALSTVAVIGPAQGLIVEQENLRYSIEKSSLQEIMSSILYLRKLEKKGRTVSLGLKSALVQRQMEGQLNSDTRIASAGVANRHELIDQDKTSAVSSKSLHTNVAYSEPLSTSMLLLVNYGLGFSKNSISRFSFDRRKELQFETPDPLYSNDFELKEFAQEAGLNFNLAKNKTLLNFGSKLTAVGLKQLDYFSNKPTDQQFLLWNRQLNFQYSLSPQSNIRFNYEGIAIAPPIAKLQPVLINDDPLHITQGNPFLKPSFSNRFFVGYQSYNESNGQLIGVFVNYGRVSSPIVNKMQVDTLGKIFTQFRNLFDQQSKSLNLSLFFDRKLKKLDLSAGINFNVNGNTGYNISNDSLNRLHDYTYKLQMRFSKLILNVYEFNLSFGPTYTVSGSSLQAKYPNNGSGFLLDGDFRVDLPLKFQLTATGAYQYLGKTAAFNQRFSRLMLNAAISKVFLKENALKVSFAGTDLLNQNVGFYRSIAGSLITQQISTVIRRYFMWAVAYDLHKMRSNSR